MNTFSHAFKTFATKPRISMGVFVLFLGVAIVVTTYAVSWGTQDRQSARRASYHMEEEIITGDLAFTVHSVRRDKVGAGPLVPQQGHEFLIPTLTVRNLGENSFDLIPLLHFHVKDSAGSVYNVMAVPTPGGQLSGPLLPHDLVFEEIGFEVPIGVKDPMLYFEPGQGSRNVFIVDLKKRGVWAR